MRANRPYMRNRFSKMNRIDTSFNMRYSYEEPVLSWYDIPLEAKHKYVKIFESIILIAFELGRGYTTFEQWLKETYNIEK